jgi:hypothetical protein
MKEADDGRPVLEASARALGVRLAMDVPAANVAEIVRPGEGGVSVSPQTPLNLPKHRRPPEFAGSGRDPVWVISDEALGADLCYRVDPSNTAHGFLEVSRAMTALEYQRAIAQTRDQWRKVPPPQQGAKPHDI